MSDQLEFDWLESATPPLARPAAPAIDDTPSIPECSAVVPHSPIPPQSELRRTAEALHHELMSRTGMCLRLRITNNYSTIMSVKHDVAGVAARVSLHYMFLDAPAEVKSALAQWIKRPRAKKPGVLLDAFIRQRHGLIRPARPRAVRVCTRGVHHNLAELFAEVNRAHFNDAVRARITWGNMPRAARRRSIRFGTHCLRQNLIRIHPLLDQTFVPRYFVRYIVFHEMLHAHLGISETPSGRRSIHPPQFKRIEKAYPDYARAVAWLEDSRNLRRLLDV